MPVLSRRHRRWVALAGAAATLTSVAAAAPAVAAQGHSPARAAAPSACPHPFPVHSIHRGMHAVGYTTSRGATPQRFSATVLGVYKGALAPGIDLIMVRTHSPAIKRAGGVWEGMSGSPVYAANGQLLGAVSYGLSYGPSKVIGLTPASAMYKLFHIGRGKTGTSTVTPSAATGHVGLDTAQQRALVGTGAVTAAQAQQGLQPLPTPITVSGVPATHLAHLRKLTGKLVAGPFTLRAGGAVAASRTAPASRIRPGAPFAAMIATGEYTEGGVGTVTAVCHGKVIAFGHPLLGSGQTSLSANTADALFIQRDSLNQPFVVANIGGRVGVVNQDRTVGIRGTLHHPPAHVTHVVTRVSASTGLHVAGRTTSNLQDATPEVVANAVYGSVLATLQKDGPGSARLSYAVRGYVVGGKHFVLRRRDVLADPYDIAYTLGDIPYFQFSQLVGNGHQTVRLTHVAITVHANDAFREWTVRRLQLRHGGTWVTLANKPTVTVRPGANLRLRAKLVQSGRSGPSRWVPLHLGVPSSDSGRTISVSATGGERLFNYFVRGSSVAKILAALRHNPHNNSVVARLGRTRGGKGIIIPPTRKVAATAKKRDTVTVGRATTGSKSGRIRVS